MNRDLLDPKRERRIETPFGFVPFRLLTDGHLQRMSLAEIALYLFLSLAADRRGMSFCCDQHLEQVLDLTPEQLSSARRDLKRKGLLAFRQERRSVIYQLLSLPPCAPDAPVMRLRPTTKGDPDGEVQASPTATAPPIDQLQTVRALLSHLSAQQQSKQSPGQAPDFSPLQLDATLLRPHKMRGLP